MAYLRADVAARGAGVPEQRVVASGPEARVREPEVQDFLADVPGSPKPRLAESNGRCAKRSSDSGTHSLVDFKIMIITIRERCLFTGRFFGRSVLSFVKADDCD